MARLTWDTAGQRYYETGVKRGVLYIQNSNGTYGNGVAWNGIIAISESPSGAEASPIYADDIKYLNLYSTEEFAASLEAYSSPASFAECDGTSSPVAGMFVGQQARKSFGICYRTSVGNDIDGDSYGYKLHFIYGCKASPSEKSYQTVNDSPEAMSFSWEITTTPVDVAGLKPTATVVVDSTQCNATCLAALEDIIYGTSGTEPRLPLPDEIKTILTP